MVLKYIFRNPIIISKAMKTIRKQIKHLALLFATLILLQSCVVYQKSSVSLEQAAKAEVKVKVITKTNNIHKFKYITSLDGEFYGIEKRKGEVIKYPLQEKNINIIRPKSKGQSIAITLLAFSPLLYVVIGGAVSGGFY